MGEPSGGFNFSLSGQPTTSGYCGQSRKFRLSVVSFVLLLPKPSCNTPLWDSAGTGSALAGFSAFGDGREADPCLPQSALLNLNELFETEMPL